MAVTACALALSGCSSSKSKTGGLGSTNTGSTNTTQTYKVGFIGALSGPNAQLGINERNGASLAIDQANASGKYKFKITLDAQDSEGDPAKAPAAATALISDPAVVAVIGPAFSGESKAVNPSFCSATPPVPTVTASASNAALQTQGNKCWHRIIPNDNVEGSQGADWLARTGSHKVFVLSDLSTYGAGVAGTVAQELKVKGVTVVTGGVDGTTTKNYNPIAQTITASGVDALFYGGYDAQAALLAKALVAAGFHGRTVGGNGIKSSIFTSSSGAAGNGWYMTCGCQDATIAPSAKAFTAAYTTKFNSPPSTYSPEAYDAANLLIDSISKAGSSVTRTSVLDALNKEDFQGITAQIQFQADGEVLAKNLIVNLFQQKAGVIKGLGNINQIN
ncbi:MAG: branched-chain amino acid ABC transporter substrate-binding protein [Jatrophihabitantaceae bacterium]